MTASGEYKDDDLVSRKQLRDEGFSENLATEVRFAYLRIFLERFTLGKKATANQPCLINPGGASPPTYDPDKNKHHENRHVYIPFTSSARLGSSCFTCLRGKLHRTLGRSSTLPPLVPRLALRCGIRRKSQVVLSRGTVLCLEALRQLLLRFSIGQRRLHHDLAAWFPSFRRRYRVLV